MQENLKKGGGNFKQNSGNKNMKSNFKKKNLIITGVVLILLIAIIVAYFSGFLPGINTSKVVASVNGEEITQKQVQEMQESYVMSGMANFSSGDALEQLVNMELLYQEAAKEGYNYSTEEVEQMLSTQLTQQNLTREEFKQQIEAQNNSYEERIEDYKKQIAIQQLLEQEMQKGNFSMSDEKAREYYEMYKNNQSANSSEEFPEFEEIKEQIKSSFQEQNQQEVMQKLTEELRQEAIIEYY